MIEKNVSVILPVYNENPIFLSKAIDSILSQEEVNVELLICDDGSSNKDTLETLERYRNNSKITIIRNEPNKGLPYTLNKLINLSKFDYVARMDSDDISFPKRLIKEIDFLIENENISFVSSSASIIDEKENIIGEIKHISNPTFKDVLERNCFIHPAILFRKKDILKVGLYSLEEIVIKGRCEDYELWNRLYSLGFKGHNINENLLYYREIKMSFIKRKRLSYLYLYKLQKKLYNENKAVKPSKKRLLTTKLHMYIPSKISYAIHRQKTKRKTNEQ